MATRTTFGAYAGHPVEMVTLENQNQTRVSVLNYAGIVQEFSVLDGEQRANLVLSSENLDDFTGNDWNINRLIGRTAGRIGGAKWEQDGMLHKVPVNDGGNNLHAGPYGLNTLFYTMTVAESGQAVTLQGKATEAHDGFPGDLDIAVTYELTDQDELVVRFAGTQLRAAGVFNPTQHLYFNLADHGIETIENHDLYIDAEQRLETEDKVPTGALVDNFGSAYDLKYETHLNDVLPALKTSTTEQGFDDAFKVPVNAKRGAAWVKDPESGRKVTIYSDRNGMVAFTANGMGSEVAHTNRGVGHPWLAVALEAQTLPNSENHPELGDVTIQPNETQVYEIRYHYEK